MNEAELTRKIKKALETEGCYVVKIHGGPHQQRGVPDLLVCNEGMFHGIEVKMPGKERTLTRHQHKGLRDIRKADGASCVVTSVEEALDFTEEPYETELPNPR